SGRHIPLLKPSGSHKKTAMIRRFFLCAKKQNSIELDAEPLTHFLVSLDHTAQPLTEAVLVEFLAGFLVPDTAAIRGKLIAQHHATINQTEFQLVIHQQHPTIQEQLFQHIVHRKGHFLHAINMLLFGPAKAADVVLVHHGITERIVLEDEFERGRIQVKPFLHTETSTDTAGSNIAHHALERDHLETLDQRFVVVKQADEMGFDAGCFQLLHDERIELVVDHAFAIQLLDLLAI